MKELSFERMEMEHGGGFNGCDIALTGASYIWGAALTAVTGGAAAFFLGAAWAIGTNALTSYVCHYGE